MANDNNGVIKFGDFKNKKVDQAANEAQQEKEELEKTRIGILNSGIDLLKNYFTDLSKVGGFITVIIPQDPNLEPQTLLSGEFDNYRAVGALEFAKNGFLNDLFSTAITEDEVEFEPDFLPDDDE